MQNTLTSSKTVATCDMVLATDLDGTFLGGTAETRKTLYDWLRAQSPRTRLIFVTGRDPGFISELCAKGDVPAPEYVIGDVGTTIARFTGGRVQPIVELEAPIADLWRGHGETVRERLQGIAGLKLQTAPFRYRLSYEYGAGFDPDSLGVLQGLNVDILISHGCFVDILPKGISKGPSLLRLIAHLGLPADRVLVAGDTLNDLSMFQTGLHGAVVGGAESELLAATRGLSRAHHCAEPGAGGILEAISAFGLHPNPPKVTP
ncbi:HAD family hydrolase [Roseinatronobacter alkalisoli]|uniref:HAD family hydrolase n=1 Tax=Roseinatronobacter alkalisoli TaxID=3028235 RepID=A0ABT5TEQ6_9RHOB|nr:HAD family hydrolase [Roseinatronobacter sp. HJB301]MDD7972662.1 HAD family hydrolase [Roseinatronobacter sp. HJB301]